MNKPVRVQLERTKGWRMPENTVKVDRTTRWGNPFVIGQTYPMVEEGSFTPFGETKITDNRDAVSAFKGFVTCPDYEYPDPEELRGKNLACWCPLDAPCHADVLLELANTPDGVVTAMMGEN